MCQNYVQKVFIKIYAYIPLAANTLKASITNTIAIRIDMIGDIHNCKVAWHKINIF